MTATEHGPRLCVAAAPTHWMPQIVTTLESKGLAVHDSLWQKTRADPFAEVWDAPIAPLLRADTESVVQATTILDVLEQHAPGGCAIRPTSRQRVARSTQSLTNGTRASISIRAADLRSRSSIDREARVAVC